MGKSIMGSSKKTEDSSLLIPSVPKFCLAQGCKRDATFAMAKVSSHRGIEHRAASDVMTWTRVNNQLIMSMSDGYMFIGWFARCAECHRDGMQRVKARLRGEGEHRFYV